MDPTQSSGYSPAPNPTAPATSPAAQSGAVGTANSYTVEFWTKELNASKKWMTKFHNTGHAVEKKYLAGGAEVEAQVDPAKGNQSGYQLFWSNVQVLLALLYGRLPQVEVNRLHMDPNDDVARVASNMLERIFKFEALGADLSKGPYSVYKHAILDRLVPGLGVSWARYTFQEAPVTIPAIMSADGATQMAPPVQTSVITDETVPLDYVRWSDFRYSPCTTWDKKWWVARRVPMTKEEVTARFGQPIADAISYTMKSKRDQGTTTEDPYRAMVESMADIWEIWCLRTRSVHWVVEGYDQFLDQKPDILKLKDFFPTPEPLHATVTSRAFLPRADYAYVQDQYYELDIISQRTKLLTEALRVVGVYDKTSTPLKRLLKHTGENDMIPVDNWAMFAEKGGIKGVVDWFPMDVVAETLDKLTQRKGALVQEVYEIMGISDIMRGASNPYETLGAQKLKASFGTARSDLFSGEVATFITSSTRIRGEIICRQWQPQTIIDRSQILQTADGQNQQLIAAAIQLLKGNPQQICERLNVSADSFTSPDWAAEQKQRTEFLQAISQFIGMVAPLLQQNPAAGPFVVQVLQWTASGFKAGKQIEGVLDQALQAMLKQQQAQMGKPKALTPEEQTQVASAEKTHAEAKKINVEVGMLIAAGFDPRIALALDMVPPARQVNAPYPPPPPPPQPGMPGMLPGGIQPAGIPGAPPAGGNGAQPPGPPPPGVPPTMPAGAPGRPS